MIALGSDHAGYQLKEKIKKYLLDNNIEVKDLGTCSEESVDYPLIACKVARSVVSGECNLAILCCGTGVGISIAANKIDGIRAACCSDKFSCEYSRRHNDANVLCLGGRVISEQTALELVDLFLHTDFEGGRHQIRVDQITALEKGELC